MTKSYLFASAGVGSGAGITEGFHVPDDLIRSDGAWIHAAGSATLSAGLYMLKALNHRVWLAVEEGETALTARGETFALYANEACFLPIGCESALDILCAHARCLWIAFDGPSADALARALGASLPVPLRQRVPLTQMDLARQAVAVASRHNGSDTASYQLQYLMYGMLASHAGQPVVMDVPVSSEIARVVDALCANRYKDTLSLAEMAALAGMPPETFRKRFTIEIGMPPQSYVLHCKIERAKALLCQPGCTVSHAGVEVGINDPYHFSKQFKNVVGLSPSAFMKLAGRTDEPKE